MNKTTKTVWQPPFDKIYKKKTKPRNKADKAEAILESEFKKAGDKGVLLSAVMSKYDLHRNMVYKIIAKWEAEGIIYNSSRGSTYSLWKLTGI